MAPDHLALTVVLAVVASCSPSQTDVASSKTPATTTAPAPMPPATLKITVRAEPPSPTKAELADLNLQFVVENTGSSLVDPRLEDSILIVDGKPFADWPLTIANGPRDARWKALPAGDRLEFGYRMGASLFTSPGPHTVALDLHGTTSPPITVTLRP